MTMRIYSAQDCYFRITHVDVHGNTQVIYPTNQRDNNFIRAGETRRIPDNTRFRMTPETELEASDDGKIVCACITFVNDYKMDTIIDV